MDDASSPSGSSSGILPTFFALPFVGVGLWAAWMFVSGLGEEPRDWESLTLFAAFATVFGGGGLGMIAFWRYTAGKARRAVELRRRYPSEPWRWREDWAEGRVRCSTKGTLIVSWAMAIFWNAISAPLVFELPAELAEGNSGALVALLFPLVGLVLLVWAGRSTMRWCRFGESVFELATIPGVVGGTLGGTIHASFRPPPGGELQLRLTCLRRIRTGTGKDRRTRERMVWQEEVRLPAASLVPGPRGVFIPVGFRIPFEAEPTSDANPRNRIVWRLEAAAEASGVDYDARFEVPVFRTAESSPAVTEVSRIPASRGGREAARPLDSKVVIRPSPFGGTEFFFGRARNVRAALGLTAVTLIWIGLTLGMSVFGAPLVFPIVFGCFGALMLYATLSLWLGSIRLVVERPEVVVRRSFLGGTTRIPAETIQGVRTKIGMTMGRTPFYDVVLERDGDKPVTINTALPGKREAEWLVEELHRAVASLR